MYQLLCAEPTGFRFKYLDDSEQQHEMAAEPMAQFFDDTIFSLGIKLGNNLTPQDIIQCISDAAEKLKIDVEKIDWLGLALYSQYRFSQSVSRLGENDSPQNQLYSSTLDKLSEILYEISEKLALAIDNKLKNLSK